MSGAATSGRVLELARVMLDGRRGPSVSQTSRMAALLARQALEEAVDTLCGLRMRHASMRSRLLYVRVLVDSRTADRASVAWHRLSHACHHHAFELAPTTFEIRYLVELVSTLVGENR